MSYWVFNESQLRQALNKRAQRRMTCDRLTAEQAATESRDFIAVLHCPEFEQAGMRQGDGSPDHHQQPL